jgi:hypothetical protein
MPIAVEREKPTRRAFSLQARCLHDLRYLICSIIYP